MELQTLDISGEFDVYLDALIDRQISVQESFDICKFIDVRESCESRQYIDGFDAYVREAKVLGNGECMSCWDESAELAYPEEDEFEEALIAAV